MIRKNNILFHSYLRRLYVIRVLMSLLFGENVVSASNSLGPDETPSYSASNPDPSCLHNYDTIVVSGGLLVKWSVMV